MSPALATWIASGLAVYVAIGILYAAHAHWKGLDPSDPDVASGTLGFRIAVTPGLVALWPILMRRGLRPAPENFIHDRRSRP